MPHPSSKIPPLLAEKLAAGELSTDRVNMLKERYALDDEQIARLIDTLQTDNQAILEAYPPERFCQEVARRAEQPHTATIHQLDTSSQRWTRALAIAALLALTAGASLLLLPDNPAHISPPPHDTIRIKGPSPTPLTPHEERLHIWRDQRPSAKKLELGDTLHEGDTLQLEYVMPQEARPGLILSIDGEGTVTLHHPSSPGDKARLEQGTHRLPYSYTLDDAPLFERFIMIECTREVDLPRMLETFERHVLKEAFASSPRTSSPALPDSSCSIQADQTFDKRGPATPSLEP